MAIERELTAWQQAGGFSDRDNALRWVAVFHGGGASIACTAGH